MVGMFWVDTFERGKSKMITTDQAIALAREVGATVSVGNVSDTNYITLKDEELTALCNAVRKQTLLEAAEWFDKDAGCHGMDSVQTVAAVNLRRMAEVE